MAYNNNMRGTIGRNKRREKSNHPDYNGSCEIDGVEYWISGWMQENRTTHEKFLSLAFKEKDAAQNRREPSTDKPGGFDSEIMDDHDPF
jgi:hypothetical protein